MIFRSLYYISARVASYSTDHLIQGHNKCVCGCMQRPEGLKIEPLESGSFSESI